MGFPRRFRRAFGANLFRSQALRSRFALVLIAVWIAALGSQAFAKPDTLVVCPAPFRDALREWEAYRHAQGHEILVVDSPKSAAAVQQTIRQVGAAGGLKYVLLIGQAPSVRSMNDRPANTTVPTNYVTAKVNIRWGSDAHIATDIPFADLDGDNLPDVAIGRIPASSPAQLVSVLRKSMNYERLTTHDAWERKLDIASGNGNFGAVTDALIEAAARQVITQCVPAEYVTQHICPANINVGEGASALGFAAMARQQLNEGSLAWVYLGHGWITELDRVPTLTGKGSESILSVGDVTKLHCGGHSPLAVLVACYTGAMDAPQKCLANELLMADEGPVAVIAATRVTMPYGNTVLGCELLRACFRDRPEHLGDTLLLAERKTLAPSSDDQLRTSLDSLAGGLSPMPVDLTSERQEHVMMYHLFGDPLLHLRRPVMNEAPLVDGASSSH